MITTEKHFLTETGTHQLIRWPGQWVPSLSLCNTGVISTHSHPGFWSRLQGSELGSEDVKQWALHPLRLVTSPTSPTSSTNPQVPPAPPAQPALTLNSCLQRKTAVCVCSIAFSCYAWVIPSSNSHLCVWRLILIPCMLNRSSTLNAYIVVHHKT